MPRNRIIYNTQGLYFAPYSGEQNASTDYYLNGYQILKRLEKIQNFNYSIDQSRIGLIGFGANKSIFRNDLNSPTVNFSFSYIPDGVTNENRLNFNVNHFSGFNAPMFSGLCQDNSITDEKDFYLAINKNENDLYGNYTLTNLDINPTTVNDVIDPNSNNYAVLNFQNCYLTDYNFRVSVDSIPIVTQSYVSDNINFYISGSGIRYTTLDLKSGINQPQTDQIIIPQALNYYQTGISGQNILLPGDASVTFYTNNTTGVLFYTDTIQSLEYSLAFERNALRSLNYKFPLGRKLSFPVNGKLSTSFIVEENLSGSFFDTLNRDDDYNVVVDFNTNKSGVYPTKLIFSGCKFDNISYDSSIGKNKTASLNFNFELDPTFGNRGIFASGNVLYGVLNNQKKVLIF